MKRQLEKLADKEYDLLVVGGGIFGLFIAWDGALRGLSVALIDKGDFGGATSSNSLRIIHGGFRYLESLDLSNARRFIREQRIFMKLAPHLVKPMPVVIPIYTDNPFKNASYKAALKIYDLLGIGIGNSKENSFRKFRNQYVSRNECVKMVPDIEKAKLNGGILFTDCQLLNSERFALEIAHSAFEAGAHLANYVEALSFIEENNKVAGAEALDNLTGDKFRIRARVTVNGSGPWLNNLLSKMNDDISIKNYGISKAFNIFTDRDLTNGHALGLNSRITNRHKAKLLSKDSRYLFITPWKGRSLIGTEHLVCDSDPDNFSVTKSELLSFLDDVNNSYPGAQLGIDDIKYIYGGFIPAYSGRIGRGERGIKNYIYDHEKEQGLRGLLSVSGNKYTQARIVAQETIDLIIKKIEKSFRPSITESTPLYCAEFNKLGHNANNQMNDRNLITKTQVDYAIKEEMAQKLTDVVFRRIDLTFDEIKSSLKQYSQIMAKELNWDDSRIKKEEDEVISRLSVFH